MNRKPSRSALLAIALLTGAFMPQTSTSEDRATPLLPPVAKKVPRVEMLHGDRRVDDYYWMREKSNPEVIAYLEAENAYTEAMTKDGEPLAKALYTEMLARIKQTDLSVPYLLRGYYYYSRTIEGKQYPIQCRKKGSLDAPEEVLLDLNDLASGHTFLGLGALVVSDDGKQLAFSLDTTGFRQYTMHVKDLTTGQWGPESVGQTGSIVWSADNTVLFYTVEDAAKRQYRLYRHHLGEPHDKDELLYEEKDEHFSVGARRTLSKAYVLLTTSSHTASEVYYLAADDPNGAFRLVAPREKDQEYYVDHHGDRFFIRTNKDAPNFRLVSAPVTDPSPAHWTEVVQHRHDVMLEGMTFFANHYVLAEREGGLQHLRITDFRTGATHQIAFPEPVYTAGASTNAEYETSTFRYAYQSMITPSSIYDYDMDGRTSTLLKRTEVLGGYDPAQYETERVWAKATDGARSDLARLSQGPQARRHGADGALRLRLVREQHQPHVQLEPREPARSRRGVRDRAHPRRRRNGQGLARAGPHDAQEEHVHRFHRVCRGPDRAEVHVARPAGDQRRQRGRPAHGRGRQHAARPVQGGHRRGAVRGRGEHDERRLAPADGGRVRGVGQPADQG